MGSGALVVYYVATAIGFLILLFPIAALVVKSRRKSKFPWLKGLGMFGVCVAIVACYRFVYAAVAPQMANGREITLLGAGLDYLPPLAVALVVISLLWRDPTEAA